MAEDILVADTGASMVSYTGFLKFQIYVLPDFKLDRQDRSHARFADIKASTGHDSGRLRTDPNVNFKMTTRMTPSFLHTTRPSLIFAETSLVLRHGIVQTIFKKLPFLPFLVSGPRRLEADFSQYIAVTIATTSERISTFRRHLLT